MGDDEGEMRHKPMNERVAHKNWKVRLQACEDMTSAFQQTHTESDPIFSEYASFFAKLLSDTNAVTQEKSMEALLALLDRSANFSLVGIDAITPLAEKGLAGRPSGKSKATECILMMIEVSKADPTLTELLNLLKHKNPKVISGVLQVIRDAIKKFGIRAVPPKPILKTVPACFEHADKNVRSECQAVIVELYRWIGEAIKPSLSEIRPGQLQDLEKIFAETPPGKAVPEAYLRSERPADGSAPTSAGIPTKGGKVGSSNSNPAAGAHVIDAYDLAEPVDILLKIKSDHYEGLASSKWSDRKDQLEFIISIANVPKILPGDFHELAKALKQLVNDANVVVVQKAVVLVGLLCKGLRKEFSAHMRQLLPLLFDKLKDKKAAISEAIQQTLDATITGCIPLLDLQEEITVALNHKVPKVKAEVLDWLARSFTKIPRANLAKSSKFYIDNIIKLVDDGAPEVRESCMQSFASLLAVLGERSVGPFLDKIDKMKATKIRSLSEKVEGASAPPAPEGQGSYEQPAAESSSHIATSRPDSQQQKASVVEKSRPKVAVAASESTAPVAEFKAPAPINVASKRPSSSSSTAPSPTSSLVPASIKSKVDAPPKRTVSSAGSSASGGASGSSASSKSKGSKSGDDEGPPMMNKEALEQLIEEMVPGPMRTGLSSGEWKQRLAAMEELTTFAESLPKSMDSEMLVRLMSHSPGWKESNLQVVIKMIELITHLATSRGITKRVAAVTYPLLVEKVGDIRAGQPAFKCLTALCEVIAPNSVLTHVYKLSLEHKNPKVLSGAALWMVSVVEDFGMSPISVKGLIEFSKSCLENPNPQVKSNTIKLLVIARRYVGPGLRDFLNDVKPALLTTIDAEFAKVANAEPPPPPTRQIQGEAEVGAASGDGGLPRTDISNMVTPKLLKALESTVWKDRQDAMGEVEQIIVSANKRIQPNLGNLIPSLKLRLADSNRNLVPIALTLLGNLATAAGPGIEKYMKGIISPMLVTLTDNKATIRASGVQALDQWAAEVPFDAFVPFLPPHVADAASSRKDVLGWIAKHAPKLTSDSDLNSLIKPLISCLEDRAADVRHPAEAVLTTITPLVGFDTIQRNVKSLKPASQMAINPIIEKIREICGSVGNSSLDVSMRETTGVSKPTKQDKSAPMAATVPPKSASTQGDLSSSTTRRSTLTQLQVKPQPGTLSRTSSASTPSTPSGSDGQLPMRITGQKELRARKDKKAKIAYEDLRPDFADALKEQMVQSFSEGVLSKLFGNDFKNHVDGINILLNHVIDQLDATIDNLDLILKYASIRVSQANPTSLLKVIEYLEDVIDALKTIGYNLSDYEAMSFLPYFFDKLGNNKEAIREKMQHLVLSLEQIYPGPRMCPFLLEGLKSKNSRSRVECLDILSILTQKHGLEIFSPSKNLPIIASQVDSRDKDIRSSALNLLAQVYMRIGDGIWKLIPGLADASRSMVEEKFKYVKPSEMLVQNTGGRKQGQENIAATLPQRNTNPRSPLHQNSQGHYNSNESINNPNQQSSPLHPQRFSTQQDYIYGNAPGVARTQNINANLASKFGDKPANSSLLVSNANIITPGIQNVPQTMEESEIEFDFWVTALHSDDERESIEAMKHICQSITAKTVVLACLSDLVILLTKQMRYAATSKPISMRLSNYVSHTFTEIFGPHEYGQKVPSPALMEFVREAFDLLQDPNVATGAPENEQVHKRLNDVLAKVFENGNQTAIFNVLIELLRESIPTLGDRSSLNQSKRVEITLRYLLKQTKAIPKIYTKLNVDEILLQIHFFLQTHPPTQWRGVDDLPLRAVKSVMNELTKVLGPGIKSHLTLIPPGNDLLSSYLDLMLKFQASTDQHNPSQQPGEPNQQRPVPGNLNQSVNMSFSQMQEDLTSQSDPSKSTDLVNSRLASIFKRIGEKSTSVDGLMELHRFKKANPHIDIQPYIARTSAPFQSYIIKGLMKIEASEQKQGWTPQAGSQMSNSSAGEWQAPPPMGANTAAANAVESSGIQRSSIPGPISTATSRIPGTSSSASTTPTSAAAIEALRERLRAAASGASASNPPTPSSSFAPTPTSVSASNIAHEQAAPRPSLSTGLDARPVDVVGHSSADVEDLRMRLKLASERATRVASATPGNEAPTLDEMKQRLAKYKAAYNS